MVPQRVQTAVHPLANVADGFPGRSHVYILNMSLESGQRGQAFVAGLTAEFVYTTWRQKGPISLFIAALAFKSYVHAEGLDLFLFFLL